MYCLDTNQICSNSNKRCKTCQLDDCKNTLRILEEEMKKKQDRRKILIKAQLPEPCKECTLLEIIDLNKQLVRCPYMINERCLIE